MAPAIGRDWYGPALAARAAFLRTAEDVARRYMHEPIATPVVEPAALFESGAGVGDALWAQMYHLAGASDARSLVLRPEGTSAAARALIESGYRLPPRVYYAGPMFRRERPQRGRFREFVQFGVERFGEAAEPRAADFEVIEMAWRTLPETLTAGRRPPTLFINTIGDPGDRTTYRRVLLDYLRSGGRSDRLSPESQRRFATGDPWRILDSEDPRDLEALRGAPDLADVVSPRSQTLLRDLIAQLDAGGVPHRRDPRLVRGLDYYNHIVFEIRDPDSGLALIAGGRYDGLVKRLGGRDLPAVGWAAGVDRIVDLLGLAEAAAGRIGARAVDRPIAVVQVGPSVAVRDRAREIASQLRLVRGHRVLTTCGSTSAKTQLRRAAASNCRWSVIVGPQEVATGQIKLKDMDTGHEAVNVIEALPLGSSRR